MAKPKPKKSLGQHWLQDEDILRKVCAAGEVGPEDVVVEVGPGLGDLTKHLVKRAKRVVAVELDENLVELLPQAVDAENLAIVNEDIIKFDFSQMPEGYKVVGNIPYYLTGKLLRQLVELERPPAVIGLLIQKEVAERITAEPGDMSVLGFVMQYFAECEITTHVTKDKFIPVPEVDSSIVKLTMREQPYFEADQKKLFKLVKAGFGEKRKMLKNSLTGGLRLKQSEAVNLIEQSGIDAKARAQELSLDDWRALYYKALELKLI